MRETESRTNEAFASLSPLVAQAVAFARRSEGDRIAVANQ
jgi:hypothetical protein